MISYVFSITVVLLFAYAHIHNVSLRQHFLNLIRTSLNYHVLKYQIIQISVHALNNQKIKLPASRYLIFKIQL